MGSLGTGEKIVAALAALLREKDYDAISVSDLARAAGVSRMSYYRNFRSVDEVLGAYLETLLPPPPDLPGLPGEAGVAPGTGYFQTLFETLGKQDDVLLSVLRGGHGELLRGGILASLLSYFGKKDVPRGDKYRLTACAGAFVGVFSEWLASGKKETPAELAALLCEGGSFL